MMDLRWGVGTGEVLALEAEKSQGGIVMCYM